MTGPNSPGHCPLLSQVPGESWPGIEVEQLGLKSVGTWVTDNSLTQDLKFKCLCGQDKQNPLLGRKRETWQGPQNFPHPKPLSTSSCGFSRVQPVLYRDTTAWGGWEAAEGSPSPHPAGEKGASCPCREGALCTVLDLPVLLPDISRGHPQHNPSFRGARGGRRALASNFASGRRWRRAGVPALWSGSPHRPGLLEVLAPDTTAAWDVTAEGESR